LNKRVPMKAMSPLMEEILKGGGSVAFTVTGDSMRPLLRHRRDRVCLRAPGEQPLKKYEIPLFVRTDGKYILHRIVGLGPDGYIVRGDNQLGREYPVWYSQVIGVVAGIWRDEKYLSCNHFRYRLYCKLWAGYYPFRWIYYWGNRLLFRIYQVSPHSAHRKGENENEG